MHIGECMKMNEVLGVYIVLWIIVHKVINCMWVVVILSESFYNYGYCVYMYIYIIPNIFIL